VYNVKKRLEDGQDLQRHPGGGRKFKVDPERYHEAATADPNSTITSIAEKLVVHRTTASKRIKQLGGKSLRRIQRPLLSQKQRDSRLERAQKLVKERRRHNPVKIIVFSDEKTFTVDPVFNRQNDRVLTFPDVPVSESARYVTSTKHPTSVMMLGLIASNG